MPNSRRENAQSGIFTNRTERSQNSEKIER